MTDQDFTIDFLSTALVVDLDIDGEVSKAIETLQGGILSILDLLDVGEGVLEPAGAAASALSPSSSFPSSTSTSTAATPAARLKNAAELKSELTTVYQLANRGKTEQARAALAEIPSGKELHIRSKRRCEKLEERRIYLYLLLAACCLRGIYASVVMWLVECVWSALRPKGICPCFFLPFQ
jgi:hypothetical protein